MNRKHIALVAVLALTACNRGGFQEYNHKADTKAIAVAQAKTKAMRRATGPLVSAYYSASMAHDKTGVTIPDKAPRTTRAALMPTGSLAPSAGSLTTMPAPDAGKPSREADAPTGNDAAANALAARMVEDRNRQMRAETRKAQLRNAARGVGQPKTAPAGKPNAKGTSAQSNDVTLPATSGK